MLRKRSHHFHIASSSIPKNYSNQQRQEKLTHPPQRKPLFTSIVQYRQVPSTQASADILPQNPKRKIPQTLSSSPTDCRPDFLRPWGKFWCAVFTTEAATFGSASRVVLEQGFSCADDNVVSNALFLAALGGLRHPGRLCLWEVGEELVWRGFRCYVRVWAQWICLSKM